METSTLQCFNFSVLAFLYVDCASDETDSEHSNDEYYSEGSNTDDYPPPKKPKLAASMQTVAIQLLQVEQHANSSRRLYTRPGALCTDENVTNSENH